MADSRLAALPLRKGKAFATFVNHEKRPVACVIFFDLHVVYWRVYDEAVEKRAGALQLDWTGLSREAQILSKLPHPPSRLRRSRRSESSLD